MRERAKRLLTRACAPARARSPVCAPVRTHARACISCGGMQHVGTAELAAAVCRAGGLGVVTALTQPTPELLRAEIRRTRALVGESVPFAVNLAILPMLIPADYSAYVDVICEERVAAIEISAGSPRKFMPRLRAAGVKVIHKVRRASSDASATLLPLWLHPPQGLRARVRVMRHARDALQRGVG